MPPQRHDCAAGRSTQASRRAGKADDKGKLKASHFFLSTVVDQLQGFLSHRWRANPQETADALMLHFKLRLFIIVILAEWAVGLLLFVTFTPLAVAYLVSVPAFAAVAVFTTKHEFILRQLRCTTPAYWFDKATVHQTEQCLTSAGLYLFGYYLKLSRQLVILFVPEYIERVWCVYMNSPTGSSTRAGRASSSFL